MYVCVWGCNRSFMQELLVLEMWEESSEGARSRIVDELNFFV